MEVYVSFLEKSFCFWSPASPSAVRKVGYFLKWKNHDQAPAQIYSHQYAPGRLVLITVFGVLVGYNYQRLVRQSGGYAHGLKWSDDAPPLCSSSARLAGRKWRNRARNAGSRWCQSLWSCWTRTVPPRSPAATMWGIRPGGGPGRGHSHGGERRHIGVEPALSAGHGPEGRTAGSPLPIWAGRPTHCGR